MPQIPNEKVSDTTITSPVVNQLGDRIRDATQRVNEFNANKNTPDKNVSKSTER